MTDQPINPLTLARDLGKFRDHLAWVKDCGPYSYDDPGSEVAEAFLVLLDALAAGQEQLIAIATAIRAHDEATSRNQERRQVARQREAEDYQRRMAEEEITRKVECPYCGAAPQASCRTVGPTRSVRTDSHRDRYRLARRLNEEPSDAADLA